MPQFVAIAALAVANAAQVAIVAAGLSTTAAAFVGTALYSAVSIGIYVGIAQVAAKVLAPGMPKPGSTQVPLRQSFAPRRSAFGLVRTSGVYALFEAVDKWSVDVIALHDGEIDGFERYYLNDDRVEINAGGGVISPDGIKYPATVVWIYTRVGADPNFAIEEVTEILPAWDASHRGDGVAHLALVCRQTKAKHMSEDFPNGLPLPSAAYRAQKVYDPRATGQIQGDKSTYAWSENPALCLMAYLTDANGGMGLDYAARIAPAEALWIAAADDCDAAEAVSTSAGTETRYRCAGAYDHDNAPSDVVGAILDSFDGWMAQRGDGALALRPGRYVAPTVTFTDQHVLSYSLSHFLPDEQAVNEYVPTYTDPDSEFTEVDTDPVRDEADIAARGLVRSQKLGLPWVPSASQAVRVARRKLDRATQEVRGSITTNLYGMEALGERYIKLEITDTAALNDLVIEVTGPAQVDLANLTVTFPFVAADTTIDDGDPGAEVTPPGSPGERPTLDPLSAPTISSLTAVYDNSGGGVSGARIEVVISPPEIAQDGVDWRLRWRVQGSTDWVEVFYDDVDATGSPPIVTLLTGFVTATGTIEVQAAYETASRTSPWSSSSTILLSTPSIVSDQIRAGENITAPALVNLYDGSPPMVRRADATTAGREAHGFILDSATAGQDVEVFFEGTMTALAGLTTGGRCYLGTTPGAVTQTAPSASANLVQPVGVAKSATEMDFEPGQSVELA